jgi:hypothetical protein
LWERDGELVWHAPAPKNASSALWLGADEFAASSASGEITIFGTSRPAAIATLWTRFGESVGYSIHE